MPEETEGSLPPSLEVQTPPTALETASPGDPRVDQYMSIVKEAMNLPPGDPARETAFLKVMDQLEVARTKGEIEASVIGEGRDRAIILRQPAQHVLTEPAQLSERVNKGQGFRFGDMTTVRDTYLSANRAGFTGMSVIESQAIQLDPKADMFTAQGAAFNGWGENALMMFERQYGKWLDDCSGYVRRGGLDSQRRISDLMLRKDYQPQPDPRDTNRYPTKGILGLPQGNKQYMRDGEAWKDSDSIKPDGYWAKLILADEESIDKPSTRMPESGSRWFDIPNPPRPFNIKKTETVEKVLKANIKEAKPQPALFS